MRCKDGVILDDLCREMDAVHSKVDAAFASHGCAEHAVCTCTTGGRHKAGSKHYINQAADYRRPDWPNFRDQALAESVRDSIHDYLGRKYDVVLEKDHIHIEYDPKGV